VRLGGRRCVGAILVDAIVGFRKVNGKDVANSELLMVTRGNSMVTCYLVLWESSPSSKIIWWSVVVTAPRASCCTDL
jgi:hypothetical protein